MRIGLEYVGAPLLHSLGRLPSDFDELQHLETILEHVYVLIERRSLAPLGHNGEIRTRDKSHE